MTKEFPRARRPREELILDFSSKHHVKCEIVQYLASHQLSGLRFLYKNYKNVSASQIYSCKLYFN